MARTADPSEQGLRPHIPGLYRPTILPARTADPSEQGLRPKQKQDLVNEFYGARTADPSEQGLRRFGHGLPALLDDARQNG